MVDDEQNDDQNPLSQMLPPADNPEYHKRKAEHEENLGSEAGKGAMQQYPYLAERMQRVRKNPPKADEPTPAPPPRPEHRSEEPEPKGTGLQIDPSLATRYSEEPAAPAAPAAAAPIPETPVMPSSESNEHPMLKRLREDFGIDQIPFEDININEHIFTLRVLDTASVTSALRFADTLSISPRENTVNLQIALISFAVLAVDSVPLWLMFEVPLGNDEKVIVEGKERAVFDPMNPPIRVRTIAATAFMDFLNLSATASLSEELWNAYNKNVDPKGSLKSLLGRVTVNENEEEAVENIPLP